MKLVQWIVLPLLVLLMALPSGAVLAEEADLAGTLVKELGITEKQATGGAGALFNMAKNSMKKEDFSKVAEAVPSMDKLLDSAPSLAKIPGAGKLASLVEGGAGKAVGLASLADQFSKLKLDKEMIGKFTPVVLSYVESKGGSTVVDLLKGVWQ
jgi:hypothetical protein